MGPFPARFRASGSQAVWTQWLQQHLSFGELDVFKSTSVPPTQCGEIVVNQILKYLVPHQYVRPTEVLAYANEGGRIVAAALAYHQRNGSIIECTPSLLTWLRMTDLTRELPAHLLRLPYPAIYVHGLPLEDGVAADVEGVYLFEHGDVECPGARALTLIPVCWNGRQVSPLESMTLTIMDEAVPIIDWLQKNTRGDWTPIMASVAKILLYVGLKDARQVVQSAYTDAPRNFSGLGKRKRALKLEEIERLYDRILVGPDHIPTIDVEVTSEPHHLRPHWRRGHFRHQPYGSGGHERRLIFISPTIVNNKDIADHNLSPKSYRPTHLPAN